MFDKKQVENVLDRILSAPSFDGASSTVKTIRKMLEAELNTTFSTEQKSWVKRKLTERMASMARVKDAEAATLIENQKYTVEERLMMMLGFTPVPNGMGAPSIGRKRSSSLSSSSSSSSSSTSSGSKRPRVAESLLERSSAKKASADAMYSSNKLRAVPLFVAAQLLIVEHGEEVVEDQEEKAQHLLVDVIKMLKFCARLYIKNDRKGEAAVVYAYCAVVQTTFMRCRWAHYDILRKSLLEGKTTNFDKFTDMMHGVSHLFDGYRMWKQAKEADAHEAECLSNWNVITIQEAHRIVNEKLQTR